MAAPASTTVTTSFPSAAQELIQKKCTHRMAIGTSSQGPVPPSTQANQPIWNITALATSLLMGVFSIISGSEAEQVQARPRIGLGQQDLRCAD